MQIREGLQSGVRTRFGTELRQALRPRRLWVGHDDLQRQKRFKTALGCIRRLRGWRTYRFHWFALLFQAERIEQLIAQRRLERNVHWLQQVGRQVVHSLKPGTDGRAPLQERSWCIAGRRRCGCTRWLRDNWHLREAVNQRQLVIVKLGGQRYLRLLGQGNSAQYSHFRVGHHRGMWPTWRAFARMRSWMQLVARHAKHVTCIVGEIITQN